MSRLAVAPFAFGFALLALSACAEHGVPDAFEPENLLECEALRPCEAVSDFPAGPGYDDPTEYEPAQLCALENLATGGHLVLDYVYGCEGMCYVETFLLRSNGSVLRQDGWQSFDENAPEVGGIPIEFEAWEDAEECLLKDAAYFQDCIDNFGSSCATPSNWVTDCNPPSVVTCGE